MEELPVLFLSFANDAKNPLEHLSREEDNIFDRLSRRAKDSHFFIEKQSISKTSNVANAFTRNWNEIAIFHFSGHANPEELQFADGRGEAQSLSQLLKLQKNLKLIFLNACSTYGHVSTYLEAGVPMVIGTSAPVNDRIAADFAIAFYEALSMMGVGIKDAFEFAKGRISLEHSKHDVGLFKIESSATNQERGFKIPRKLSDSGQKDFKWGLYYSDENALDWVLPYRAEGYNPNASKRVDLTEILTNSFAHHCKEIRRLKEEEEDGEIINRGQYRASIIKCLPSPLGIHVQKVFSSLPESLDQATLNHIQRIVSTYSTLMELMAFSMLAQLWEALSTQQIDIKPSYKAKIRELFTVNVVQRERHEFVETIRSVRKILDDNKIDYFIEELAIIKKVFNDDLKFSSGIHFMENMKQFLTNNQLTPQAIPSNYLEAESHLSYLLQKLSFCAKYSLTAIKDIHLIQPRHKAVPSYNHHLIPLIACGTYDLDKRTYLDYTNSRSVILLRDLKNVDDFLTLTPFIIDKNAYDEKSKKSSIYFFNHYDREEHYYVFQDATRPQDKIRIQKTIGPERKLSEEQKYHNELVDQFAAFADLLFQKSFENL